MMYNTLNHEALGQAKRDTDAMLVKLGYAPRYSSSKCGLNREAIEKARRDTEAMLAALDRR